MVKKELWLLLVCPSECNGSCALAVAITAMSLVPLCLTLGDHNHCPHPVQARIEVMIAGDMSNRAQTLEKRNAELQVRLVTLL